MTEPIKVNEVLENQIIKLKNLYQYKNKTREELLKIIEARGKKKQVPKEKTSAIDVIDISDLFNDKEEITLGKELLDKYLEDFKLENISDINLLKQLIYLEVFQKLRLQKTAESFQKQNNAVPLQILDSIHKNLDKIIELKNSLHLTRNSSPDQNDAYKAYQILLKKIKIWNSENQATREKTCPHCGKMVLWIMRPEVWETYKHPYFKDKILSNPHLVKLYSEGKLNKEDLALILGTSPDYTEWLCNKWGVSIPQTVEIKEVEVK
jgi:hypothetical protein